LVSEGDRRGEVWWVSDLTPEGMAAIPQLLLEDRPRVLVVQPELASWAGGLGARLLADDEGLSGALQSAIASWPVSAAPAESDDEG
jgi:hypothetical protein